MKTGFYRGISIAALAVSVAFPALAEITAQEVRDELVGYYTSFGYQVDIGSETLSGDALTVNDMALILDLPNGDGQVTVVLDTFTLRETGDGAVQIELPEQGVYFFSMSVKGTERISAEMNVNIKNFVGLASGSVGSLRVETHSESFALSIDEVTVQGKTIPVAFVLGSDALASDYTISKLDDGRRRVEGEYAGDSLGLLINIKQPGGDGFLSMTMDVADVASVFSASILPTKNPEDLFAAGFDVDVELDTGPANIDVSFQDGNDNFAMTAGLAGSHLSGVISKDKIAYDIAQNGVEVSVSSSQLPIPAVRFGYDEVEISFEVPMAKSAEPSDFHLRTALRGLSITEAVWAMFDPAQTLPRDPATVAVDISGKVMVLFDLMDIGNLANAGKLDGPPMLPVSLDLNELTVEFAGAALNGEGAFTFDFTNPKLINGLPLPTGEVNLGLEGALGLMDKLVAIGLLKNDMSMGVRAMLGVFARPVGDDQFESKIEITSDGAILANGQRIQ